MMHAGLRRVSLSLLLGSLVLAGLSVGCNEGSKFNKDQLFSLHDYAQDQDYALVLLRMMNQWRSSTEQAKSYLAGNTNGIPFSEAVPQGWTSVSESQWGNTPWPGDNWYYQSFQDAEYQFVRFDEGVPEDNALRPAKVEFMNLKVQTSQGLVFNTGDSISVEYRDNFANQSVLVGDGSFSDVRLLYISQGVGGTLLSNFPAVMINLWSGTFDHMASAVSNPQANYSIEGVTTIMRADQTDQVDEKVRIDLSMRANKQGSASIVVDGVERARVTFENIDLAYHGYVTLRSSGFLQKIRF